MGSWRWDVPEDLKPGVYQIKVVGKNSVGKFIHHVSDEFLVLPAPGERSIKVVTPLPLPVGVEWEAGTSHTIEWESVGDVGNIHINLMRNGKNYRWLVNDLPADSTPPTPVPQLLQYEGPYGWTPAETSAVQLFNDARAVVEEAARVGPLPAKYSDLDAGIRNLGEMLRTGIPWSTSKP